VIASSLGVFWLVLFLNRRRIHDYQYFAQSTMNQNAIVQIVQGMPEIKLNQCENRQRWRWEVIQAKLFKLKIKVLALEQYQQAGVIFTNEGKNILITFIAANQVINGEITLGMMMAITYILGQVNAPIEQLLDFIHKAQDAKISMERLGEIQDMPDENQIEEGKLCTKKLKGDIVIHSAEFKYSSHDDKNIIDGIDLVIPENKVTAIVGTSGGGKTTLMKILLSFFSLTGGSITVGGRNLKYSNADTWRSDCGAVLQDGFLFSDSVVENITMGKEITDWEQVIHAAKTANIHDDIEMLPQGYHTKIGREGHGLSGGQTQRILIARAVYKNPDYLFFDEATSALDSSNEKTIQDNLKYFFKNRTVVIIAHRLSTVKYADQIVVLHQGKISEVGSHSELTMQKGRYFDLVKNQLELGT
jgi:ATP-binding cassette subfamily B protein